MASQAPSGATIRSAIAWRAEPLSRFWSTPLRSLTSCASNSPRSWNRAASSDRLSDCNNAASWVLAAFWLGSHRKASSSSEWRLAYRTARTQFGPAPPTPKGASRPPGASLCSRPRRPQRPPDAPAPIPARHARRPGLRPCELLAVISLPSPPDLRPASSRPSPIWPRRHWAISR